MLKKKYKETIIQEDVSIPSKRVFVCFCILKVFLKKVKFY